MKVKALRGVCIGVDRHLKAGDVVDLEPALVTYLTGIGAVERVPDEPPKPDPVVAEPVKTEPPKDEPPKSAPAKSGGKEK
jgi:hypothetical protein